MIADYCKDLELSAKTARTSRSIPINSVLSNFRPQNPQTSYTFIGEPGFYLLSSLKRIDELRKLSPNWDSYDAKTPSPGAASIAKTLLISITSRLMAVPVCNLEPYDVIPTSVGGFQIEWQRPNSELEIEISPDGFLSYLLTEKRDGKEIFEEQECVDLNEVINLTLRVICR